MESDSTRIVHLALSKRTHALFGLAVTSCIVFILYPVLFSDIETVEIPYSDADVIHIVLTLRGSEPIRWAEVMVKSMLYYQGRFQEDNDTCSTTHFPQRRRRCIDTIPIQSNRIIFHVLIDSASRNYFIQAFRSWHRPYLQWQFYAAEYHETLLRKMPNSHHSGIPSMMKLLVPVILPTSVEKVIVMDSDMLFNHNVLELWELFDQFNETQAIGLSWTLKAPLPGCKYFRYSPITDRGLNGGLSIMHLKRLRENGWHEKWQEASQKFFERNTMLKQADQDIFNTVIEMNPTMYFRIPCEWNIQLCSKTTADCCPVVWPMKTPDEKDCLERRKKIPEKFTPSMARLVHFTGQDKEQYVNNDTAVPSNLDTTQTRLTQTGLKNRFGEIFRAFQALPSSCFYG